MKHTNDLIDVIIADWQKVNPEIDTAGTAVIGRIVRLSSLIAKKVDANLANYSINIGEFDVLAALLRADKHQLSPGQIQDLSLVSSGGLSNQIKRLENNGYVSRTQGKTDGRSVIVQLTPSGKALIEDAARSHIALEKALIQSLTPSECESLQGPLHELLLALDDE